MNQSQLQATLKQMGCYAGAVDGAIGPVSRAAIIGALTSKTAAPLTQLDYAESGERLGVDPRAIKAVVAVESGKTGFGPAKLPLVLAEPHIFSRLTDHQYDAKYPAISYRKWDKTKYPKDQASRWDQITRMVSLDVDAGFSSASYGRFQLMGFNHKLCGYADPWSMVLAHSRDEEAHLMAFEQFIINTGLLPALKARNWAKFAKGYNGASYAVNKYDQRLAAAFAAG